MKMFSFDFHFVMNVCIVYMINAFYSVFCIFCLWISKKCILYTSLFQYSIQNVSIFFLSIDGNFRYQCHSIFINIRLIFFSSSNKLRFGEIIQKKNRELKIKMMSGQIYLTIHRKFVFSINIIKLD